MAALVGDVTGIQDEELLRRMWQDTEDFGRKKEIRARMYKLREQRLKEFYTTGEVLSDVLTTGSAALDAVDSIVKSRSSSSISNKHSSQQVIQKTSSYTTSSGGNFANALTHADSITDEGFMTMKSKEIRDSESPTRDFHRRQQLNQANSQVTSQDFHKLEDDGGYWKVVQESSSEGYNATGTLGEDGNMVVHSATRSEKQNITGGSDTDGLSCVSQVSASENTQKIPFKEAAIKDSSDKGGTSVVVRDNAGGKSVTSSTSQKWSSSQSQREERVSSSSTTSSSTSRIVHKDSGFSEDFKCKDSLTEQGGSRKGSLIEQSGSRKSSLADQNGSRKSSLTTPGGKYRVTQRSSTTEVPFGELLVALDEASQNIKSCKTGDKITIDINVACSAQDEKSSTTAEQKIMTELHDLDSFLSTQKSVSTPASPGDAGNWTIVSGQQTDGGDKTEEFVFRTGREHEIADSTTRNTSSSFISQEKVATLESSDKLDTAVRRTPQSREQSPEKKPSSASSPSEPKKGIMKQPSQDKMDTTGQYVTTYTEHFTNKRISVETDRNHDAFAKSLRTSPERGTPTSTRSSSKVSLDRSSPTRNYRNKTSADSTLSLNRTSPTRKSPGRSSPEKTTKRPTSPAKSATPKQSPSGESPERSSPSRSSPVKGFKESPEKNSPSTRTTSPDKVDKDSPLKSRCSPEKTSPTRGAPSEKRRSSSARNSPEKDVDGPDKLTGLTAEKFSKPTSRRVSAGDRPRTDVTSKISVVSTIKEKRRLSSGATRAATKKRCSTPGTSPTTSPTRAERQSRPRSRGSSRSNTDSDGSESETKTYTRDTEEDTRRYQQAVTDKEESLMTNTTNKEISVDKGNTVVLDISKLIDQEKKLQTNEKTSAVQNIDVSSRVIVQVTDTDEVNIRVSEDVKSATVGIRPDSIRPVGRTQSPSKNVYRPSGSPVSIPAVAKITRDKSPEYSSEGSLANELPHRPANKAGSPVKQLKTQTDRKESSDSSPERNSFAPIKRFRTSPEDQPTKAVPASSPKPSSVSPAKPVNTRKAFPVDDSSEDVEDKEPQKPAKPISTRPAGVGKSPERPNASPANDLARPKQTASILFKFTKPSTEDMPSEPETDIINAVPEVTRRSPTPESPMRRGGRESESSSVSPCSSPERQSDRERDGQRGTIKKSPLKKKTSDHDKPTRAAIEKAPGNQAKNPEKSPIGANKKPGDATSIPRQKSVGRRSDSPSKVASPVRRESLPRRQSKENRSPSQPQTSDSSPERSSPERRTARPTPKTQTASAVPVKTAPKSSRPSSIPRAGSKTPTAADKPLERKPSWSKTLRGPEPPRETQKFTKPSTVGKIPLSNRSVSADSKPVSRSIPDRKKPSPTSSAPKRSTSARNSPQSPSSSPERKTPTKAPQKTVPPTAKSPRGESPVKSAFVRTNSKPSAEVDRSGSVPKKLENAAMHPKSTAASLTSKTHHPKPCCDEDHSTDRSSSLSSPETVRPAGNTADIAKPSGPSGPGTTPSRPNAFVSKIVYSVETVDAILAQVNTAKEDYYSDEYEDLVNEKPPVEFSVGDDSPVEPKTKISSIPTVKKSPATDKKIELPLKKAPSNKDTPEKKVPLTTSSAPGYMRPVGKTPEIKKTPSKPELTKASPTPQKTSKPETPKTFRSVVTVESRITRANSDKNVARRQSPSPSTPTNRRQTSKPQLPRTRSIEKPGATTTRSTLRQQTNTLTSVTTRVTAAQTTKSPLTSKTTPSYAKPKATLVERKPTTPSKTGKPAQQTGKPTVEKKVNGAKKETEYDSFSSEDEEGLPEECPSLPYSDDESYIREMEELRRDEEAQYASKVTSREDALLTICQDKLKTSRDSLTIVDIRLKSSRESSPDSRGPRYADRVSEPEDDDYPSRKPEAVRFQKPVLQPNPLDEETDDDLIEPAEEKTAPKVVPKSILSSKKPTPSEPEKKLPQQAEPEYPVRSQDDLDDERPKRPSEYLQKTPQASPDKKPEDKPEDELDAIVRPKAPRDFPQQLPLQVTDLDASDTEESLRLSVSVSDRVSQFLETTKLLETTTSAPQTPETPTRLSNLDSPSAVNKARAMFETIATTQQTSPPSPRQKDILSRPSVFEARKNGPWANKEDQKTRPKSTESPKTSPKRSDFVNEYPSDEENTNEEEAPQQTTSVSITKVPKGDVSRDKSPPRKTNTDTFTRRKSAASPERPSNPSPKDNYRRDKSPPAKTNTSPKDTYPRDKSPPGKTDTYSRRKPSSSPERTTNKTPKDTYPRDKSPPGKISANTYTRPNKSFSPERPSYSSPKESSPTDKPGKTLTDTITRRKSPDRADTHVKPKPLGERLDNNVREKSVDKYASFPSQTRGSRTKVTESAPKLEDTPSEICLKRRPSQDIPDAKDTPSSRRDSFSRRDSSQNVSPIRRESIKEKDTVPTRKDSLPTRANADSSRDTSPVRKASIPKRPQDSNRQPSPTRQVKESPRSDRVGSSPEREQPRKKSSIKSSSPVREYTGRDSPVKDVSPARKPKDSPTRKNSLPKDSKRIVSLETSSTRGSEVFGVALRSTTTTTSTTQRRRSNAKPTPEDEEEDIEQIFDLDVLETMLEKVVGYDKRRRIRAQIRIVRRQTETSSVSTTKMITKTSVELADKRSTEKPVKIEVSLQNGHKPRTQTPQESPSKPFQSRVKPQETEPTPTTGTLSPKREQSPKGRRPSDTVDYQKRRSPSPVKARQVEETVSRTANFPKRLSKTEITIELKPSSAPVKTPAKKWSIGEKPQEACPVTSSYGVGPTDENGRPLFGLRALRKSHNTQAQTEIEPTPSAPELEEPVRDNNGRALFGGLRALQVNKTSSVVSERTSTRRGSGSVASKEETSPRRGSGSVVSREEVTTRRGSSSVVSREEVSTRRDSCSVVSEDFGTRDMPEQPESPQLRDLVSRHEQRVRGNDSTQPLQKPKAKLRDTFILPGTTPTKLDASSEETSRSASHRAQSLRSLIQKHESIAKDDELSGAVARPSILKKSSESYSKSTVVTSRGTMRSDGTVSLTRDIIRGETVQRNGEEPITTVTRTQQRYDSPDEKLAIEEVDSNEDFRSSSRKSSFAKTSSPERDTASVTSNNSYRRSKTDSSEKRSSITGEDQTFTSSVSLNTAKTSGKTSPTRNVSGKFSTSTPVPCRVSPDTTPKSAPNRNLSSARRQIFSEDDNANNKSATKYTTSTTVTTTKQVSNREQKYSTGVTEDRRTSQGYTVDYNDDDESDGYQGPNKFDESSAKSSPRSSPDKVIPGYDSSETQQKSFTTSSASRRRSSTPLEDGQPTPTGTRTITRGNSIRALQEKFQQAAAASNSESVRSQRNYPKAGLIFRSASFKLNNGFNGESGSPVGKLPSSAETIVETSSSRTQRTSQTDSGSRSFIGSETRVTGVQDILTRMRNADQVVESGDTVEDSEARALLNKFLGAQVILQGMEPLVNASQGGSLFSQVERHIEPLVKSTQLVGQAERQRVTSTSTSSSKVKSTSQATNGREEDNIEDIWDEDKLRKILDNCTDYDGRRQIRARLRVVMAEQKACSEIVSAALADQAAAGDKKVELHSEQGFSESKTKSSSVEGNTTTQTEVTTKTSSFSSSAVSNVSSSRVASKAPSGKTVSPFAKFQQLDRQNSKSAPNSPKTPQETAAGPLFKFTDSALSRSASTVKDRLLYWCQIKTKEYKNIQIDNFSTCWSNGLAFCALIHHFLPDAFDYESLKPEERRKNFELAFQIADDKAGIAPLLDVEDMVVMRKPDWKCVFTYVQSIYRRFKDED